MTEIKPQSDASLNRISAGGLETHYQQIGSGPRMVLIHGMNGSLADWQLRIAPRLSDQFSVLTFDLRGHGYSDMPPSGYTSADMARDLVKLMDALRIDRAHIVGHSFGATIALHFTALYPDRVIATTISDTRLRALQPAQKVKNWVHWPRWKALLEIQGLTLNEESDLDFTILEILLSQRPGRRSEHWRKLLSSTTARTDLADSAGLNADLLRRIDNPTQAIFAEFSFCLPTLEAMKPLLPHMQWTVLPGVGHLFPATRPELFVHHVKAFHGGQYAQTGAPSRLQTGGPGRLLS